MTVAVGLPHPIAPFLARVVVAAFLPLMASGCSPVGAAVGVGAAIGLGATQERGLAQSVEDGLIELEIKRRWLRHDAAIFRRVDPTVHGGRALLTGTVASPEMRVDAVRLAWQVDGVREVVNEIAVAEPRGFGDYLQDGWLVRRLELKILLDERVRSINYNIDAVHDVIYLMGIAQNEAELRRVIDHARDIAYVRRIVSHVRLKGDSVGAP